MTIRECAAFLHEHDNYLLLTHVRPDGDTLGSAAALCSALRRMGKRARLYDNPGILEILEPFVREYIGEGPRAGDCVVSVDTSVPAQFPEGFTGEVALSIDHHESNDGYAAHTLLDAGMTACGEIVLRVIEQLCGDLTPREAELLYIALSTDCGCFCFANTNETAFLDAARLLKLGVNNGALNKMLFRSYSRQRIALEGMIYSGMRSYCDGRINVIVISREMMEASGATEDDCEDVASLPGKVRGNEIAITVRELEDGRAKASVRTGSNVSAREICQSFGGGGHPMAAGCTTDLPLQELADRLVEAAKEYLLQN